MGRSSTRHKREIHCIDSAGEHPWEHGEVGNDCPNGGGPPTVYSGIVIDGDTVQLTFTGCVSVVQDAGINVRINTGTWLEVTNAVEISAAVWQFDLVSGGPIVAGDIVEWQYVGALDSILDCEVPPEDIGAQGPIALTNPLIPAGAFMLSEDAGIVLVEDDVDETAGIFLEDGD